MKFALCIAVAACLLANDAFAQDGAFGFVMGANPETLKDCVAEKGRFYSCKSAPKAHPEFIEYGFLAGPKSGLCSVLARSGVVDNSNFGDRAQSKATDIAEQISKIYGRPEHYNFLKSGSIWKEPRDWSMAISKGERHYTYFWTAKSGATLKNNVEAIALEVEVEDGQNARLLIRYQFKNAEVCREEIKAESAGSF